MKEEFGKELDIDKVGENSDNHQGSKDFSKNSTLKNHVSSDQIEKTNYNHTEMLQSPTLKTRKISHVTNVEKNSSKSLP